MKQSIHFGRGAVQRTGTVLAEYSAQRIFLVTGQRSYALSGAQSALAAALSPCQVTHFHTSAALPELDEIEGGIKLFQKGQFDLVLGVGGGSVLDTAKLISTFARQTCTLDQILDQQASITPRQAPLVLIPTTAGSGAEATHFAVLYRHKIKYSIAHPSILADAAIIDPDLSMSLPPRLAAISGMDALSQAIESYWSNGATEESKSLAKESIGLSWQALKKAVLEREAKACTAMSRAALLAGQAINISKTSAPHAVSYALTAYFGIPHGHAVALTLGHFLVHTANTDDTNVCHPLGAGYVQKTVAEICALLGAATPETARDNILELMQALGLETHLSDVNVPAGELALVAKNINLERLSNHPRRVSPQAVRAILKRAA